MLPDKSKVIETRKANGYTYRRRIDRDDNIIRTIEMDIADLKMLGVSVRIERDGRSVTWIEIE